MKVTNFSKSFLLSKLRYKSWKVCHSRGSFRSTDLWVMGPARFLYATLLLQKHIHRSWKVLKVNSVDRTYQNIPNQEHILSDTKGLHDLSLLSRSLALRRKLIVQNSTNYATCDISHARCVIADDGFDPPISWLWAQHSSSEPLCCCRNIFTALEK